MIALISFVLCCGRLGALLSCVQVANRVFRSGVFFLDQAGGADVPQGVRGVPHHRDQAYSGAVGRFETNGGRGVGRRSLNSSFFLVLLSFYCLRCCVFFLSAVLQRCVFASCDLLGGCLELR